MLNSHNESPVDAVRRVLARECEWVPSNTLVMMLIDAVRDTTPPPREVTIGMLAKILKALEPNQALDAWADRSSREIVRFFAHRPEIQHVTSLVDEFDESLWCMLEGMIAAMLLRACRGEDLT